MTTLFILISLTDWLPREFSNNVWSQIAIENEEKFKYNLYR